MRITKNEYFGYILGGICFMPSFFIVVYIGNFNPIVAMITLIISQGLWLTSIDWCTRRLWLENMKLRKELKTLKGEDNKDE